LVLAVVRGNILAKLLLDMLFSVIIPQEDL